jgi:hypothetical protein
MAKKSKPVQIVANVLCRDCGRPGPSAKTREESVVTLARAVARFAGWTQDETDRAFFTCPDCVEDSVPSYNPAMRCNTMSKADKFRLIHKKMTKRKRK